MKRTNFAFRYEWNLAIAHLSPEYRLEILEATIRYAETGETGRLSDIAAEAFRTFILPDFERRRKAATYRARSKARKAQKEKTENQPVEPALLTAAEEPQDIEKSTAAEVPAGPNRRERRLLQAQEKRLQKKRLRNAAARAKSEVAKEEPASAPLPPLPRMYTPFWL